MDHRRVRLEIVKITYRQKIVVACTGELTVRVLRVDRLWSFLLEIGSVGFGDWIFKRGVKNSKLTKSR